MQKEFTHAAIQMALKRYVGIANGRLMNANFHYCPGYRCAARFNGSRQLRRS
jgi:hypothetical protein